MDDLITFLRTRCGEDLLVASSARGKPDHTWPLWTTTAHQVFGHDLGARGSVEASPARVLARVEGLRTLLNEWEREAGKVNGEYRAGLYRALKCVSLEFSMYPDYREEWRP